jgi:hypothetical protein
MFFSRLDRPAFHYYLLVAVLHFFQAALGWA